MLGKSIHTLQLSRNRSVVLLLVAAVLWSTGGFMMKMVSLNAAALAGWRGVVAALVMLPVVWPVQLPKRLPQFIGIFAYAISVLLFVGANKLTTAANAIVLYYTAPIYVATIGAWILREKTRRCDWVAIGFVLAGMVLFFLGDFDASGLKGMMMALASGAAYAATTICLSLERDGFSMYMIFWGNVLAIFLTLPFMLSSLPTGGEWPWVLALGAFQIALPYLIYVVVIRQISALEAIIISMVEPILNPTLTFLVLQEKPGLFPILGSIVVLTALTVRNIYLTTSQKKASCQEKTTESEL